MWLQEEFPDILEIQLITPLHYASFLATLNPCLSFYFISSTVHFDSLNTIYSLSIIILGESQGRKLTDIFRGRGAKGSKFPTDKDNYHSF